MTKIDDSKRALVVGLGDTGLSCARYLVAHGYRVNAVDTRAAPPRLAALRAELPQVSVHTGGLDATLFADPGLVVVSPGLSPGEPVLAAARARGVEIVGDVELFARVATAPVLAITGSNGKSTVTALAGAMCHAAGLDTAVGGNIGTPVLELLRTPEPQVYVLELSSFQLGTTESLRPLAATVLNVSADHMDRYRDLAEYTAAKARIFTGAGTMVLNRDDARVLALAAPARRIVSFGLDAPQTDDDFGVREYAGEDWLVRGDTRLLPARAVPLAGRHNLANVLAAMALAQCAGVTDDAMCAAVRGFTGLPHRTALVLEHAGVRWIDDSKGTNVGATVAALNGMTAPVVLIAGGDGKGADFTELKDAVAAHARALVLIGRDAPLIERALAGAVPVRHARDLHEAVAAAQALASPGDVVLLSPACASFDMFRDYRHRGEEFAHAVRELCR